MHLAETAEIAQQLRKLGGQQLVLAGSQTTPERFSGASNPGAGETLGDTVLCSREELVGCWRYPRGLGQVSVAGDLSKGSSLGLSFTGGWLDCR